MKRTWTIIGVSDVAGSCKRDQSLFGQPAAAPTHADFGQILDSDELSYSVFTSGACVREKNHRRQDRRTNIHLDESRPRHAG